MNIYGYVGGNPVSQKDPRGLDNPNTGPYDPPVGGKCTNGPVGCTYEEVSSHDFTQDSPGPVGAYQCVNLDKCSPDFVGAITDIGSFIRSPSPLTAVSAANSCLSAAQCVSKQCIWRNF